MNFKKMTLFTFGLACAWVTAGPLQASPMDHPGGPHNLGIGLRVGSPTAFSLKYWFDNRNALDLAVGTFGYYGNRFDSGINIHLDYLWHKYGVFGGPSSKAYRRMPLYFGVGGLYSGPDVAGVRGVIGTTWLFEGTPFDLFFDLAPTLIVTGGTGFGIDAGLGGRYYF